MDSGGDKVGSGRVTFDQQHGRWFVDVLSPPSRKSFKSIQNAMNYANELGYRSTTPSSEPGECRLIRSHKMEPVTKTQSSRRSFVPFRKGSSFRGRRASAGMSPPTTAPVLTGGK